jgi:hypothetical protein
VPLKGKAVMPKVINLRGRLDIDVPDDPAPRLRPRASRYAPRRRSGLSAPWIRMRCPWIVSIHNSPSFLRVMMGSAKRLRYSGDLFGLPQVGPT